MKSASLTRAGWVRPPTGPGDQPLRRWRTWIVKPILAQLTQGTTPEQISLSLAIGGVCAFFPILGAATPLCLVAGAGLRLNQAVIQLVNGATVPLYPLAVLGLIRLGDALLGRASPALDPRSWAAQLQSDPVQFLHRFGPVAGHALIGWAILAPVCVLGGYLGLVPLVRRVALRLPFAVGGVV
jgi:uncharacterized protein (DUF2062 family)